MKQAFYADYIYYNSRIHSSSWLLVDNNTITGIEDNPQNIPDEYEKNIYKNSAIFPGLINTHAHLAMSAFRGLADDLPLITWLNHHMWPAEKKYVNPEFVYNYTLLSIAESIRSGVTCINDMYFHSFDVANAIKASGIRGVVAFGIMNFNGALKKAADFEQDNFVKSSIAPHSLYTVKFDLFKECVEFARTKNILLHTHLAETKSETDQTLSMYNKRPITLMAETGALDYSGAVFAHCVQLLEEEIKLLGDKKVNISHCLESNLKLASGFAPINKLIKAGANVSIGTDGAASNNDQSMLNEMSSVSKFHKAFNLDAEVLSAKEVLNMATINAAKALNFDRIGILNKGYAADFFVLSFNSVHMTPVYNPISHLVYTAQNSDITHVFVDGKAVMIDGRIISFDENKIKTIARNEAKKIKDKI